MLKISLITQPFFQERQAHSHTLFVEPRFLGPMGSPGVQAQIWPPSDHGLYMVQCLSKFRPHIYCSFRDPASQRKLWRHNPLVFYYKYRLIMADLGICWLTIKGTWLEIRIQFEEYSRYCLKIPVLFGRGKKLLTVFEFRSESCSTQKN